MSYNNYNNQQGGGYGQQSNPYAQQQQQNPYAQQQQQNPYAQQAGGYGNAQPAYGNDPEQGNVGYEMSNINGGGKQAGPNQILDQLQEINGAVDQVENQLGQLASKHRDALSAVNTDYNSPKTNAVQAAKALEEDIQGLLRNLIERMKSIKKQPESGNPRNSNQVGRTQRRIQTVMQQFQKVQADYRKALREQNERQIRIINPNATDEEVAQAVDDPSHAQIFQQALLQGGRRAEANSTRDAVRRRHDDIAKIEREMIQLATLFQEMESLVYQQDVAVEQIDRQAENVNNDISGANHEIDGAITKARSRNRKKWWCLLICLIIIIIIVVIVVVVVEINKK